VAAYQDGATPEEIVQRFETLELSEVYAVIAYFLRHRGSVQEHLARREAVAADVRQQIGASQGDLSEIRSRLERRRIVQPFQG